MASSKACYKLISIIILLLSLTLTSLAGNAENAGVSECKAESGDSSCHKNKEALKLKLIAIPSILAASMIGVSLPLFSRSVPALKPEQDMFVIVKALASGVILATGFMHVLPDSFDDLMSKCLPESPWRKFPFTTFIAMFSALLIMMVDSFAMNASKKRNSKREGEVKPLDHNGSNDMEKHDEVNVDDTIQLRRNRVIAQMLELGIIVHSVVIGLAMGASDDYCTIRPLILALCFHQFFEGMGLGGIWKKNESNTGVLLLGTTPFGIALGMGIQKTYDETSPTALNVVGVLNACSAGLLIYMALVDLLAHEFFGQKLQSNMKLQMLAYIAVIIGAGGISVMAIWA